MKKRIMIVDDHVSIRDMLMLILMRESGYEVVAGAGSAPEAVKACIELRPDVVILDLVLPQISGVEVLRRIRKGVPRTRVMVFSATSNRTLMREALRAGPDGYVDKMQGWTAVREALATIAGGGSYFAPAARAVLGDPWSREPGGVELSVRESEVLQMIGEGMSSKEIAAQLGIAVKTAENHRANLMAKLGIHEVAGLTREAVRRGLVLVA